MLFAVGYLNFQYIDHKGTELEEAALHIAANHCKAHYDKEENRADRVLDDTIDIDTIDRTEDNVDVGANAYTVTGHLEDGMSEGGNAGGQGKSAYGNLAGGDVEIDSPVAMDPPPASTQVAAGRSHTPRRTNMTLVIATRIKNMNLRKLVRRYVIIV